MTGNLQTKNNIYYAVINTYDKNGKRRPKWISTKLRTDVKGNERKANQILKKLVKEYEEKQINPFDDILFIDYIYQWIDMKQTQIDEVSMQSYKLLIDRHIIPYFKPLNLKLNDITPQVIQTFYNEKYKNGRIDGKGGLSGNSVKHIHVIVHQILNEALRKDLVLYNSADRITLPKRDRYEAKYYTVEEIHRMFEKLSDEPLLPLIQITTLYGLRRSELLGLKWDSIDFENETVIIKHTVCKCMTIVEKDKTKNNSSRRIYPMLPEIKDILLKAKEKEIENKKLFGNEYNLNDYVFKWEDGKKISPDFVSRKFRQILKKYDLPHIRFHDLRHSCASMLYEMGYDLKDIQEWLGHADIKITGNIYTHLNIKQKQKIAKSFSDNFNSIMLEK